MKHLAEQDSQRKAVVADYLNGVANDESAHPERRAQAADMLGIGEGHLFRRGSNVRFVSGEYLTKSGSLFQSLA